MRYTTRLDRLTRRMAARPGAARRGPAEYSAGGQCHTDPAHVLAVFLGMIEIGAWTIEEAAARVGLSADELHEALNDAGGDISPIGVLPPKER